MKKIIISVVVILIIVLSIELIIIINRNNDEKFFVLPQSYGYVYDEDREIIFDVYSTKKNSLIKYTDENQYILEFDDLSFTLDNVRCESYKEDNIYHIKIIASLPDVECNVKSFNLIIINEKFEVTFNCGALSISKMDNINLLSINQYYPVYSYINKGLHLVGINIDFHNEHNIINNMSVNKFAYGNLDHAIKDAELNNEVEIKKIIPEYEANKIINSSLELESSKYFIPISYTNILLIKSGFVEFVIDNEKYFLDNMLFISNDISYYDYINDMVSGVIVYDRN